ncbi:hypothetical protein OH77DRAFT_64009 [Trametes cingulata]|nr:hypothetical protein OH77DRAFT_64009 [Trametes cingulata]
MHTRALDAHATQSERLIAFPARHRSTLCAVAQAMSTSVVLVDSSKDPGSRRPRSRLSFEFERACSTEDAPCARRPQTPHRRKSELLAWIVAVRVGGSRPQKHRPHHLLVEATHSHSFAICAHHEALRPSTFCANKSLDAVLVLCTSLVQLDFWRELDGTDNQEPNL